jgi:hydroxymethylpyrimidine/phosphomethylpyrimidine kinase
VAQSSPWFAENQRIADAPIILAFGWGRFIVRLAYMAKQRKQPVALSIAGSDSGGGAGIQADLKTFAALGVHGTTAITCLTAQNPAGVLGVQAAKPEMVRLQIEAVFAELPPVAVKTGMLYSKEIIRVVADFFKAEKKKTRGAKLIVDPVMIATSGAALLKSSAMKCLQEELFPLADLITPNLDEAQALVERDLSTVEDLRLAAKLLFDKYGCAALVKGGHLKDMLEAVDCFYDGDQELLLTSPFVKGVSTHGTGCTYSAAIAGYMALGCSLAYAAELAKNYISQAIAESIPVKRHTVLNHFWE